MSTLVAWAYFHQISPRDGGKAAFERLVNSARRVATYVALAFVRAARQAGQGCRGQ